MTYSELIKKVDEVLSDTSDISLSARFKEVSLRVPDDDGPTVRTLFEHFYDDCPSNNILAEKSNVMTDALCYNNPW